VWRPRKPGFLIPSLPSTTPHLSLVAALPTRASSTARPTASPTAASSSAQPRQESPRLALCRPLTSTLRSCTRLSASAQTPIPWFGPTAARVFCCAPASCEVLCVVALRCARPRYLDWEGDCGPEGPEGWKGAGRYMKAFGRSATHPCGDHWPRIFFFLEISWNLRPRCGFASSW